MSFGNQGSVKYQLVIDDSNVNVKLNSFKNGLQQLNFATQNTTRGVTNLDNADIRFNRNIQAVQQQIDRTKQSLNQFAQMLTPVGRSVTNMGGSFTATLNPIQNSGNALNQFGSTAQKSGESFKKWGGFLKNNIANVGLLAGGIAGLDDQFLGLHKAQVANERANLMVDKSQQKVNRTQEALNKMVAAGKTGTADYALKQKDLELATEQLDIAQQRATVAQENLSERTEDFWTGIIPNALFIGGSLGQMVSGLGIKTTALTGAMRGLAASLGIVTVAGNATKVSLAGVLAVTGPLIIAIGGALRVMDDFQLASKTVSEAVQGHTLESLKALKVQLDALTTVKFDDPKSWFNLFGAQKGIIELSGVKKQVDEMITKLEEGDTAAKDLGETFIDITPKGEKLASSINNVSNAMLGILPYTERMNAEFKKTSAEAEMLSTEFETGVLASTLAIKEMAMGFDLLKNTAEPVNDEMESMLSTLEQSAPVWDKQIEAEKTSSLIMGEVNGVLDQLSFSQDGWSKKIDSSNKALDDQNALIEKFNKFARESRLKIAAAFDIKSPDEQADKLIDKFVDKLNKKAKKKLKLGLEIEAENEAFEKSAGTIISGLQKEIEKDDTLADAVAKRLIKDAPDTDEGERMKKFLEKAIESSNTGEILTDNLQEDLDSGGFVLKVPAELEFDNVVDIDPNSLGDDVKKALGIKTGDTGSTITVPATAEITKIDYTKVTQETNDTTNKIQGSFNDMASDISKINSAIAKSWSKTMNQNITNTKSGVSGVVSRMNGMASSISKINSAIAKSWSKTMNSMISNAKSGANGVISQLNRIPRKIVTVHEIKTVETKATGGIMSFAKGGIVSAATGRMFTTSGPRLVQIGDNPGGREMIAAFPYNDPKPTYDRVGRTLGLSQGDNDDGTPIIINATFKIEGNEIINTRSLHKTVRMNMGKNRSRLGPS